MTSVLEVQFMTEDSGTMELCRRYWAMNESGRFKIKVARLAKEHNISPRELAELVAKSCIAHSSEYVCIACKSRFGFSSRTQYLERPPEPGQCRECKNEAEEAQRKKAAGPKDRREVIQQALGSPKRGPIDPYDLTLENALYLFTFMRHCASEDLSFAAALDSLDEPFAPTSTFEIEVAKQLFGAHLIFVHPGSRLEAFTGENAEKFTINMVHWLLPFGEDSPNPRDLLDHLEWIFRNERWAFEWYDQRLSLWKKVAMYECLQYMTTKLIDLGLDRKIGEKTFSVIANLLEDYSIAQIYGFIWRAVKDAAAFYMQGGVTREHAANTVVAKIKRFGEHAKAEGWDAMKYHRDFKVPQSALSQVLYDVVLRIGDRGFTEHPSEASLSQRPDTTAEDEIID